MATERSKYFTPEERKEMIACHFDIVDILVHKKMQSAPDVRHARSEFESEGYQLLVEAADKFDPTRGVTFLTFASKYIWRRFLYVAKMVRLKIINEISIEEINEGTLFTIDKKDQTEPEQEKDYSQLVHDLAPTNPKNREVYYRVIVNGEPAKHLAEEFGCTTHAIKRRRQLITDQLRKKLKVKEDK